jgi:hypothetical protein
MTGEKKNVAALVLWPAIFWIFFFRIAAKHQHFRVFN